jgi:hypothetical protein
MRALSYCGRVTHVSNATLDCCTNDLQQDVSLLTASALLARVTRRFWRWRRHVLPKHGYTYTSNTVPHGVTAKTTVRIIFTTKRTSNLTGSAGTQPHPNIWYNSALPVVLLRYYKHGIGDDSTIVCCYKTDIPDKVSLDGVLQGWYSSKTED